MQRAYTDDIARRPTHTINVYYNQGTKVKMYQETTMADGEKQLHVRIPKDIFMKLKVRCAYQDISIQDYVVRLIEQDMGAGSATGVSVLLVEDEEIVRESLRDGLKDNHPVNAVATAEEALQILESQDFDVLVTDVRLPGMNGIELIKQVAARKPYIKAIVITAYPSVELAVGAMKQGAIDYLVKPVDADELEKILANCSRTPKGSRKQ